jgi:hypothetical protein
VNVSLTEPIKVTVESEEGIAVYENATFARFDSEWGRTVVGFEISGAKVTYTLKEPPVGSVVLVKDGRVFQRTTRLSWKCVDGSNLTWDSLDVQEVLHRKAKKERKP